MKERPEEGLIGIFDSGFGGLNILRGIIKELPEYGYVYLGDTARVPYGSRSKEVVYEFTRQAVSFLFKKNCEIIIIACNTASSDALRKLQREYLPENHPSKKILGVLIPASEEAVRKTKNKKIGVIATEGTVLSESFPRELLKLCPEAMIYQKACPLLVPIVESGEHNSKIADLAIGKYLKELRKKKIDTLILGCTHYGILENKIRKIVGKNVKVISENKAVPKKLRTYFERHKEIENRLGKNEIRRFYSTDLTEKFQILGKKFFGKSIKVERVELV
ncbi:MAG: Glutamate racemase [Patescibacteria group bacterium]|nr:Glutamate racemase [Patescibacteria group bacterium]